MTYQHGENPPKHVGEQVTGETLAAITSEIVSLKASSYGKGATQGKTYVCDDFLFCVLGGGMTTIERTLLNHDDADLVRKVRARYQNHMASEYQGVVERLTGRPILTYQSQVLFDPDYTVEIFVLGPLPAETDPKPLEVDPEMPAPGTE